MIIHSATGRNWWYFEAFKVIIWMIRKVIRRKSIVFSAFIKFRIFIWHLSRISAICMTIGRVYKRHLFGVLMRSWVRKCSKWAWYVRWVHGTALPHPSLLNRIVVEDFTIIFLTLSTCCRYSGWWACDKCGSFNHWLVGLTERRANKYRLVIAFWGTQGGRVMWDMIFCKKLTQFLSHGLF